MWSSCSNSSDKASKASDALVDSIPIWIANAKGNQYSVAKRKAFLDKAYRVTIDQVDTSKAKTLSKIAYRYFPLGDTLTFLKITDEAYRLAIKQKDTFTIADVHWSYANLLKSKMVYDSAYYHYNKAYTYFLQLGEERNSAKVLYGMAFIRGRYRDYSRSEALLIKAMKINKKLKVNHALSSCYTYLGLLQNDIKAYDKALFYYQKAIDYLEKNKDNKQDINLILNNMGVTYRNKGEYDKSLRYFNDLLYERNIKGGTITDYAMVLNNRAYCLLLKNDTVGIKKDFDKALKIRDSLHDKEGVIVSKLHISSYFAYAKDTLKAVQYAKDAKHLAREVKNSKNYLEALDLLANFDKKNATTYLNQYISYSDSLQLDDRKIQNKFTRIEYETNEHIAETKKLSKQRVTIIIAGLLIVVFLSLIYYIRVQKVRNEKLLLEADQQKANEQLYVLTIEQQAKLEEEKSKERKRISEELHDGILGNLFGTRMGLGFLEIQAAPEIQKKYQSYLEELQTTEQDIREVSHKLHTNISNFTVSFVSLVQQLFETKGKIGNFTHTFRLDDSINWEKVDVTVKANIYRIIQEALQNIVKYAKASHVELMMKDGKDQLTIVIEDNGVGFDFKKGKKGIGIKNMKSRIEKLHGTFHLTSSIGKGTRIEFSISKQYMG